MSGPGRARSFGAAAEAYDRYRPAPPAAAVDWLVTREVDVAVDLGAGTGGLSRALLARAATVVSLDADQRMLAVLRARAVADGQAPRLRAAVARAEALPLRAGTVNAVTVASAWHWMRPDAAVPEIARVLRPGGVWGVVWSGPDRSVPWVAALLAPAVAAAGRGRRSPVAGDGPEPARYREVTVPPGAPFGPPETGVLRWTLPYRTADLPALAATYSSVLTRPAVERARLAETVGSVVAATPETAGRAVVDLPMRTLCWRCVRS